MISEKESNFVSAVIYLGSKTQTQCAGKFINMIYEVLSANFQDYEIICVNDSASGEALNEIEDFNHSKKLSALSIVNMAGGKFPQGLEESMTAGAEAATSDYIFEFDSTYVDYDKGVIMQAYNKMSEGFDIVSVNAPKEKIKFSSRLFYAVYNKFSRTPRELTTERFRVISRRALNRIESYSKIIPYRKAVYAFSGVKSASINYEALKDSQGSVQDSDGERFNTAGDAIVLFTNTAYKLSLLFSAIMAFIMFAFGLYVVFAYFTRSPVEGWAPMMGMICLGFLAVFILQTMIFKYLELILRIEFRKQRYIVTSIERV